MIKYGLKLWSNNIQDVPQAKRLFEKGLYDYIELYILPGTYGKYIKKWRKLNIPFIIHCTHFMHGFNLARKNRLHNNLKMFSEVRTFCDDLNGKYIIFHSGVKGRLANTIEQTKRMNDKRLLVENKPYISMVRDRCRGSLYEELEEIINSCKIGFCLDIPHAINAAFHLKREVYKYLEKMLMLSPKVIHISDGSIKAIHDKHLNIKEGDFDFAEIRRIISLSRARYLTLETHRKKGGLSDFVDDVKKLKKIINN